ncbi:hypothetical protein DPMN_066514 [Dreissena polymorpha]|uniref:Uncharacterized protein n=1 Tax=Dreissena polymorpha TaxID=45954 RepID=A0A9D4BSY5_DREPO|nr:hypothetical protein DPMN_066514 [Dreissena polymorpha]
MARAVSTYGYTDIIGTNLLTKVLTRKNAPSPGSHVFQPTGIIFELVQDIIGMNLLTKFHEDRTVNVASRPYKKMPRPLEAIFFQAKIIIFELIQDIIATNLLTKCHEDWTINVASRGNKEKCTAPCGHVFKAPKTIFELIQDINGTNLLTKVHDDRKINVTSRVLGQTMPSQDFLIPLAQTTQQTNGPTNQQTGQKQYVPHYYSGGHKKTCPSQ